MKATGGANWTPGVAAAGPLTSVVTARWFQSRTASFSAAYGGAGCKAAASRAMEMSPAPRHFTRAVRRRRLFAVVGELVRAAAIVLRSWIMVRFPPLLAPACRNRSANGVALPVVDAVS